jgi:hypothetical protein
MSVATMVEQQARVRCRPDAGIDRGVRSGVCTWLASTAGGREFSSQPWFDHGAWACARAFGPCRRVLGAIPWW